MLVHGMCIAPWHDEALPYLGHIAPKIYAERVRWSRGADGLDPRLAQRPVILFFWPIRASSWYQISMLLPLAGPATISATAVGRPLLKPSLHLAHRNHVPPPLAAI